MSDIEYSCVVVHGDRSQFERTQNINSFKSGDVRFLICTDVAARGIDIKELPYVISNSSCQIYQRHPIFSTQYIPNRLYIT